jgi:hypothetical protein
MWSVLLRIGGPRPIAGRKRTMNCVKQIGAYSQHCNEKQRKRATASFEFGTRLRANLEQPTSGSTTSNPSKDSPEDGA